jgi:sec-independent protein translocase protein TatA
MATQLLFIGTSELMLIAGIALLLFGGKKLPEMMRGMGRGISEFKKGAKEVTEPFDELKNGVEEARKVIDA